MNSYQSFKPSDLIYKHQKISETNELQNLMFDISSDNIDEVHKAAVPFFENYVSVQQFFLSLKKIVSYRPTLINHQCQLLSTFSAELNQLSDPQFQRKICIMFKHNYEILLALVELGFINIENIIDNSLFPIETNLNIKKYFYPEIYEKKPSYFEHLYDIPSMSSFLLMNMGSIDDFKAKRKKGNNENVICQIIRNDEFNNFIDFINYHTIDLNSTIPVSLFDIFNNVPTFSKEDFYYIEYAALNGSIQIFKYLIQNDFRIHPKTMNAAIIGGNYEIIHLLEDKNVSFDFDCFYDAVNSHRNEIANYILDNSFISLSPSVLDEIIPSYNLEFILNTIDFLVNEKNEKIDLNSSLYVACENNFPDVVEFLLSYPKLLNINYKHCEFYNMTLLHKAALSHYIEILKILLNQNGIDTSLIDSKIINDCFFFQWSFFIILIYRSVADYLTAEEYNFLKPLFIRAKYHQ